MSMVVFRGNNKPGRVLIDSVHDAGPHYAADTGKTVATMVEQCVDQRAVRVPGRWMYDHSAGLVYHNYVSVLKNNIERDVLCQDYGNIRLILCNYEYITL